MKNRSLYFFVASLALASGQASFGSVQLAAMNLSKTRTFDFNGQSVVANCATIFDGNMANNPDQPMQSASWCWDRIEVITQPEFNSFLTQYQSDSVKTRASISEEVGSLGTKVAEKIETLLSPSANANSTSHQKLRQVIREIVREEIKALKEQE